MLLINRITGKLGKHLAGSDSSYVRAGTTATTSGTSIDITALPPLIERLYIVFDGVSLSGTDNLLVQLGDSGGLETSGYTSSSVFGGGGVSSSSGFIVRLTDAARVFTGIMTLQRMTGQQWICTHNGHSTTAVASSGGGTKTLSAELDRFSLVATGANSFDAGAVGYAYQL